MNSVYDETQWAIGFLEGDGSFTTDGNGGPRAAAYQNIVEPLERLKTLFGGSIWGPSKWGCWFWRTTNPDQYYDLVSFAYPSLSDYRRSQIDRFYTGNTVDVRNICWAAGFFEAEGCYSISRIPYKDKVHSYPGIFMQQKDRQALDWFKNIVEIGKVNGPNNRGHYSYSYVSKKSETIIQRMTPYMSQWKTDKCLAKLAEL